MENEVPVTMPTLTLIEEVRNIQASPCPPLPLVSQIEFVTYFFREERIFPPNTHSHVGLPTLLV